MATAEPIVVKVTTNNDYFGEPGVIRSIVEAFVPYIVGQPDRDVLFIHRKDATVETSITIEVHATVSEAARTLAQATFKRLINLPRLVLEVRFTEVISESAEGDFELLVAPVAAEEGLTRFIGGITNKLASEDAAKAEVAAQRHTEAMWAQLHDLPMPWELREGSAQFNEAHFIVDTLMGIVKDEYGL